jgi:cytochrome c
MTKPAFQRLAGISHTVPVLLAGVMLAELVSPATAHPSDDVQALVERAAAHIQAVGKPRAFADISNPDGDFRHGELYVFCDSTDGTVLAHGDNPKLVGKNLTTVMDAEGITPTLEVIRLGQTKGSGWVEYLWPNAQTHRIQHKVTYVLRIDDETICASGYYKPDTP